MPAPETTDKYVRVRVKDPSLFVDGSFRTIDISKAEGVKAIIGKLKSDPEGSTTVQAYLFDNTKWDEKKATQWVKDHEKKSLPELTMLYKEMRLDIDESLRRIKYYKAKILNINEKNYTADVIFSTEGMDRDREILPITSWEKRIKTFDEHPVLVSSHNYKNLQNQIGEIKNRQFDYASKQFKGQVEYYANAGNKEADWAWFLAKKGAAMFSVGYYPHKVLSGNEIPNEYKDLEPRNVQPDNELLEISQVIIGSNRGALQMGITNPTIEQNQYMYEVIKSFGNEIPEFEVTEKKEMSAIKPETAAPEIKIDKKEILISPIEIKNMIELQTIMEIYKSGRVISTKNKEIIQTAINNMNGCIVALKQLIEMTETGKPEDVEPEKNINYEVSELIDKVKKQIS